MGRRVEENADEIPRIPRELYPILNPRGRPREAHENIPNRNLVGVWKQWVSSLWLDHRLRPWDVAASDADFQAWHDEHCLGCRLALPPEKPGDPQTGLGYAPGVHTRKATQ